MFSICKQVRQLVSSCMTLPQLNDSERYRLPRVPKYEEKLQFSASDWVQHVVHQALLCWVSGAWMGLEEGVCFQQQAALCLWHPQPVASHRCDTTDSYRRVDRGRAAIPAVAAVVPAR